MVSKSCFTCLLAHYVTLAFGKQSYNVDRYDVEAVNTPNI